MKGMDLIMKKLKEELKYGKKGITLISLVVTIIVLIILAGISINLLFGENGLITMAQKAKNEYEEAAKSEEQILVGMFGKNFADYNGQLHVEGTNIVNQYGEIIQLKGLVGTAVSKYSIHYTDNYRFSYYLNTESVKTLKSWGVNVIRLGMEVKDISNSELTQDYLNTIDLLLENNLYVVVTLWNNHQIDDNIEIAKQYFETLSVKYKDVPNIIYEIANEPTVDWSSIVKYSNTLISVIRNSDDKNIIIVPNPNYDSRPDLININELNNSYNIMTSYHMYVGEMLTSERIGYLEQAITNGTPIFVTEWGTTLSNGNDGFYEDYSNAFVQLMDKYNLSWCNFQITDLNFKVNTEYSGIVKNNQWNNTLSDDILTASGKYIKSILQGKCDSYNYGEYAIMMQRDDYYAFWQDSYRDKIVYIEFKQEETVPDDVLESWDVSLTRNNSINAYIKQNNNTYELYIISKNMTNLPISCYKLFANFSNVKNIIFRNVLTDCVNNSGSMFEYCSSLENIEGISDFNTSNFKRVYSMFLYCSNLRELNVSKWNTSNIENMLNMFANCIKLEQIEGIENWDTSNVTNISGAFASTRSLKNLDLSNWNVENVTSMNETFNGSYVQNLNISNWNMSNCTKITRVFKNTLALENLYLNNVELNVDIITNYEQLFSGTKQNINIYVKNSEIAQFIYERLNENSITGNVYYGTDGNWLQYTG